MPSKGLRDVPRAAVLLLCHMVLITTLLPQQLPAEVLLGQQTPARRAALLQAPKYKTQTFLLKALGYNSSNGRMGWWGFSSRFVSHATSRMPLRQSMLAHSTCLPTFIPGAPWEEGRLPGLEYNVGSDSLTPHISPETPRMGFGCPKIKFLAICSLSWTPTLAPEGYGSPLGSDHLCEDVPNNLERQKWHPTPMFKSLKPICNVICGEIFCLFVFTGL